MKTVVFQVGGDREKQEWVSGREMEVDVMRKRQLVSHQARKWGWPLRDITTERDCWFQPSLVKGKLNVDFWEETQDKISGWSSFLSYALFLSFFIYLFFLLVFYVKVQRIRLHYGVYLMTKGCWTVNCLLTLFLLLSAMYTDNSPFNGWKIYGKAWF